MLSRQPDSVTDIFMIFFSSSRKVSIWYLKFGQDLLLTRSFLFTIQCSLHPWKLLACNLNTRKIPPFRNLLFYT